VVGWNGSQWRRAVRRWAHEASGAATSGPRADGWSKCARRSLLAVRLLRRDATHFSSPSTSVASAHMGARGWAERQPTARVRMGGADAWGGAPPDRLPSPARCGPFFLVAGVPFFLMASGCHNLLPCGWPILTRMKRVSHPEISKFQDVNRKNN
jgi:hypothetical protein